MTTASVLDADARDRFARDGFVLGPTVLSPAAVTELRDELNRVIAQRERQDVAQPLHIVNLSGDDAHPVWQVVNIWEASDAFRRLLNIPGLGAAVAQLIGGREIRLWHDQIQFKPEERGGVNSWHQDWPYWPTMSVANAVTAWIALDDADADNGCMSMVPGSHQWGNAIDHLHTLKGFQPMPASWQGHPTPVRLCPVPAGAVHFHHSLTWHGSHANTSSRPRRAIALHFMNDSVVKTPGHHHVCSRYCESGDGEPIRGAHFPLVWQNDRAVHVPAWQAPALARA